MVGKKWLKLIKSLHQKKYRNEHQLFFIEGKKTVNELLLGGWKPIKILAYPELVYNFEGIPVNEVSPDDLRAISALKNPNGVLGVFEIPQPVEVPKNGWIVGLDDVRDPGNLGTIIRFCDWFGITCLVCSPTTVDCYNPKVLQATMGSIARVNVIYQSLEDLIKRVECQSFGAFMNGEEVYQAEFPDSGILIMGSESNGISPKVEKLVEKRISIPQYGGNTAESLNVAMATGILLNEIRRVGLRSAK